MEIQVSYEAYFQLKIYECQIMTFMKIETDSCTY